MPIVIMMAHGETISPNSHLTAASCLDTLKKAQLALTCLPEDERFPRPNIICGFDNESRRTGTLLAGNLSSHFREHAGAADNPEQDDQRLLAKMIIDEGKHVILATHNTTIRLMLPALAAVSGKMQQLLAATIHNLEHHEILAFNTATGQLIFSKAPPRSPWMPSKTEEEP